MRTPTTLTALAALTLLSSATPTRADIAGLQRVASGLSNPIYVTHAPGDSSRLFIAQRGGSIRILDLTTGTLQATPFLTTTVDTSGEGGLLGLAFHPDYNNPAQTGFGKFYVNVTTGSPFTTRIREFSVSPTNPNLANAGSMREILSISQPQTNHNGGWLDFSPVDKYLYIATGDGGGGNDDGTGHTPGTGNAQDLTNNLLGKMLRIDVNGDDFAADAARNYAIPPTNPFAAAGNTGDDEIWSYGLRNPFRASFDRANGNLYVGDVGQNNIEELDLVTAGGNYGWRYKEGTFRFNPDGGTISTDLSGLPPGLIDPIMQYDHDEGVSIIGGFVYRGTQMPELTGKYVFGEFSRGFAAPGGRLFYYDLTTGELREFLLGSADLPLGMFVKGMGEDAMGELYLAASTTLGPTGTTGQVFKIVPEPSGVGLVCAGLAMVVLRRRRAAAA